MIGMNAWRDDHTWTPTICNSFCLRSVMTTTYWEIERRIVESDQGGQDRVAYGEALIEHLSSDLILRFGRDFRRQNL